MTRSDAIKILDSIWVKGIWRKTNEIDWNKAGDAIDMATDALKAQDRPIICPRCGRTFAESEGRETEE